MRPILTPEEARVAAGGLDLTGLTNPDLEQYIQESMSLINAHTHNTWTYNEVFDEQHVWSGDTLRVWTYNGPVRVIKSYKLLSATFGGKDLSWNIQTDPTLPTSDPSVLPDSFGEVKLNRSVNEFNASPLIITGQLLSLVASYGISLEISYTAGFDDGTPQDDGYTLPYPSWLKNATRMLVRHKLERWFRNYRVGMAGMLSVKSGNTMYRMPQPRGSTNSDPSIPDDALALLDDKWLPWVR